MEKQMTSLDSTMADGRTHPSRNCWAHWILFQTNGLSLTATVHARKIIEKTQKDYSTAVEMVPTKKKQRGKGIAKNRKMRKWMNLSVTASAMGEKTGIHITMHMHLFCFGWFLAFFSVAS